VKSAVDLGVEVAAAQVREVLGLDTPDPEEEILEKSQPENPFGGPPPFGGGAGGDDNEFDKFSVDLGLVDEVPVEYGVLDPPQKTLDPAVWQMQPNGQYMLRADADAQIRARLEAAVSGMWEFGERWITVPSKAAVKNAQHRSHIKINDDGMVLAGPPALKGKRLDKLDKNRSGDWEKAEDKEKEEAKPDEEIKPWEMTREKFNESFMFHGREDAEQKGEVVHGGVTSSYGEAVKYSGIPHGNVGTIDIVSRKGITDKTSKGGEGQDIIDYLSQPANVVASVPSDTTDPYQYLVDKNKKSAPQPPAKEGEGGEGEKSGKKKMTRAEFDKQDNVLFHGTDVDEFEKFDLGKAGSTTDEGFLGTGVYLSTDPQIARNHKTKISAVVDKNVSLLKLKMHKWEGDKKKLANDAVGTTGLTGTALRDAISKAGFGGVELDYSPLGYNHKEVAIYDPKHIKTYKQHLKE